MATITALSEKILTQLQEEQEKKLQKEKATFEVTVKEEKEKIKQQFLLKKAEFKEKLRLEGDAEIVAFKNEQRNQRLSQQEKQLKEIYDRSIQVLCQSPGEEFLGLIKKAITQLPKQKTVLFIGEKSEQQWENTFVKLLEDQFPFLTISDQRVSGSGFILSQETIDYNWTYERLIQQLQAELDHQLLQRLMK